MLRLLRLLTLGFLQAVLLLAPAMADENFPEIDLDKVPEYVPSPVGGHWYLRADIGMAWPSHGSHKPVFGAGIGYQFNDWLRADATLALSKGNVRFAHVAESACGGGPGTACGIEDRTSMRNISAFANIYADLGTVAGFTPYVGVGAGVAHIQWQEVSRAYSCMGESGMCPANGMTGQALAGHSQWLPAAGVTAGLSYDLGQGLKLDLSYRHDRVFGGDPARHVNDGFGGGDHDLSRHQIRIGLRHLLR